MSKHETLVSRLFPAFVETEELFTFPAVDQLFNAERDQVCSANDVRRAEFAAGRVCARRAMSRLGVTPAPLLAGADRAPIWPSGICGSITHTRDYAAAALCRQTDARAIGLDVEPWLPLDPELIELVCLPEEIEQGRDEFTVGFLARLMFSAKECAFKCQFPLTKRYLEFTDVRVAVDPRAGTFQASIEGYTQMTGRFLISQGLVATGLTLT